MNSSPRIRIRRTTTSGSIPAAPRRLQQPLSRLFRSPTFHRAMANGEMEDLGVYVFREGLSALAGRNCSSPGIEFSSITTRMEVERYNDKQQLLDAYQLQVIDDELRVQLFFRLDAFVSRNPDFWVLTKNGSGETLVLEHKTLHRLDGGKYHCLALSGPDLEDRDGISGEIRWNSDSGELLVDDGEFLFQLVGIIGWLLDFC